MVGAGSEAMHDKHDKRMMWVCDSDKAVRSGVGVLPGEVQKTLIPALRIVRALDRRLVQARR